jgi:hypothetical protein
MVVLYLAIQPSLRGSAETPSVVPIVAHEPAKAAPTTETASSQPPSESPSKTPVHNQIDPDIRLKYTSMGVNPESYAEALYSTGLSQQGVEKMLDRCADLANKSSAPVETVVQAGFEVLRRRPKNINKAISILDTIGKYEANRPGMGAFDAAVRIANGQADANLIQSLVLSLPGYPTTTGDLKLALMLFTEPIQQR